MNPNDTITNYLQKITELLKGSGMSDEQVKQTMEKVDDAIADQVSLEVLNKLSDEELKQLSEQKLATMPLEELSTTLHSSKEDTNQIYLQKIKEYADSLPQLIEQMKQEQTPQK